MASLNTLAYKVLNRITPHYTDDDNIDIREIKQEIHIQRAIWMNKDVQGVDRRKDVYMQDLGCFDLEAASSEDCCTDLSIGCTLLRIDEDLPEIMSLDGIKRFIVAPVDKTQLYFSVVPVKRIPYVGNGRFNKNTIFAFLHDDRVYLYQNQMTGELKMLGKVRIEAILKDPSLAAGYKLCSGGTCYSDDDEYPIEDRLFGYFEDFIVQKYAQARMMPTDTKMNEKEDLSGQAVRSEG